jgi:hypothetical protein
VLTYPTNEEEAEFVYALASERALAEAEVIKEEVASIAL